MKENGKIFIKAAERPDDRGVYDLTVSPINGLRAVRDSLDKPRGERSLRIEPGSCADLAVRLAPGIEIGYIVGNSGQFVLDTGE